MKELINYPKKTVTLIHEKNIITSDWSFLNHSLRYFIITDTTLNCLYHPLLASIPNLLGIYPVTDGEISKSLTTYKAIIDQLNTLNLHRNDVIIGFGGGVVTDIAGFVAGTYLRGLTYYSIPTTLLGMVDASIGGKCGLNLDTFKNQIGLFNHPDQIIIDEQFLDTLPKEEFNNGMGEIVKYALIQDEVMFNLIESSSYSIEDLITRSINIKIAITLQDEKDNNLRKILNYGHTYGHLLESYNQFHIKHGHAVAIGLIKEAPLNLQVRIRKVLSSYFDLDNYELPSNLLTYLLRDKKATNDRLEVIELVQIGQARIIEKKVEDLINEYLR